MTQKKQWRLAFLTVAIILILIVSLNLLLGLFEL